MDSGEADCPTGGSAGRAGLVAQDGKNSKTVLCQRCGSKVLCPGVALFTEKELFLPAMRKKLGSAGGAQVEGEVDGDTLTAHWLVDDMYAFENVGFTKDVGNVKYLICADCEIGPIGWHCVEDKKSFYVALERVKHA
ncbi:guanine nucleotide exchange factor MSS4 [Amia ocellicauda]|uniref:guanine nucleotide exchange factor MSS4 n=1 Tax=Amia ocellicauda TaxID=2972642 RepID=UPI003464DCF0